VSFFKAFVAGGMKHVPATIVGPGEVATLKGRAAPAGADNLIAFAPALVRRNRQGALQQAVIQRRGLITEQGYEGQAQSYRNMESAAEMAASEEKKAATGDLIGGGLKAFAALAPVAEKLGPAALALLL
jgi:hypothetical protein